MVLFLLDFSYELLISKVFCLILKIPSFLYRERYETTQLWEVIKMQK